MSVCNSIIITHVNNCIVAAKIIISLLFFSSISVVYHVYGVCLHLHYSFYINVGHLRLFTLFI